MKGRKPQPTNWKVLRGNPGKSALNKHEPQPQMPDEPPEPPPFLRAMPPRSGAGSVSSYFGCAC